jgi:hypothetical protein
VEVGQPLAFQTYGRCRSTRPLLVIAFLLPRWFGVATLLPRGTEPRPRVVFAAESLELFVSRHS